jgi:hypothetical protein
MVLGLVRRVYAIGATLTPQGEQMREMRSSSSPVGTPVGPGTPAPVRPFRVGPLKGIFRGEEEKERLAWARDVEGGENSILSWFLGMGIPGERWRLETRELRDFSREVEMRCGLHSQGEITLGPAVKELLACTEADLRERLRDQPGHLVDELCEALVLAGDACGKKWPRPALGPPLEPWAPLMPGEAAVREAGLLRSEPEDEGKWRLWPLMSGKGGGAAAAAAAAREAHLVNIQRAFDRAPGPRGSVLKGNFEISEAYYVCNPALMARSERRRSVLQLSFFFFCERLDDLLNEWLSG